MNLKIKDDIVALLKESLDAIRNSNFGLLNEISSHTVHNSSVFQDHDSTSVAVLIYALSKVLPRASVDVKRLVEEKISSCVAELEKDNMESYRQCLKEVMEVIQATKEDIKQYFNEVLSSSEIKKASAIYYHGISIGRAAEILGSNRWELMNYVGKTRMNEETIAGITVEKRLAYARKLFSS